MYMFVFIGFFYKKVNLSMECNLHEVLIKENFTFRSVDTNLGRYLSKSGRI